jgi:hypothetical protein
MYAMHGTGAMTGIINDYQSSSTTQTIWVFSCNATLDPPSFYIQGIVVDKDIVITSTATETTFLQWCTNNVQKLINGARHIKCHSKVFTDLSSQGLTREHWSLSINYQLTNSSSFSTGILMPDNAGISYNFLLDLYNTTKRVVITRNASANDPRFLQGYEQTPNKIDSSDDHSTFVSWLADNMADLRTDEDGCGFIRCRNKMFSDIGVKYWYIDYGYATSTAFYGTLHDNTNKLYTVYIVNYASSNPTMRMIEFANTDVATTSASGLMSSTDKTNLNSHIANTSIHVSSDDRINWNSKQDALTIDSAPTEGSANPVMSGGVKAALDNQNVTALIYKTGYWFGKTKSDTTVPSPTIASQNYFDFTTNTPYSAKGDLSGWTVQTALSFDDGKQYAIPITDYFWDTAEPNLSGRAITSTVQAGEFTWTYELDHVNKMGTEFSQDSNGIWNLKTGGISNTKLANISRTALLGNLGSSSSNPYPVNVSALAEYMSNTPGASPMNNQNFGICDTSSSVQAKTVEIPGIDSYKIGMMVWVQFNNAITTDNTTVNINDLGDLLLKGQWTDLFDIKIITMGKTILPMVYDGESLVVLSINGSLETIETNANSPSVFIVDPHAQDVQVMPFNSIIMSNPDIVSAIGEGLRQLGYI